MDAKVCLVTGASAGIGHAIALELLRAGHVVYGAARRVHKMGGIVAAGGHALAMDARDGDRLDRAVATVVEEQGRIDVLVNNAGTVIHGSVEEVPLTEARDLFEVNVIAPARLVQLVLPHMRKQRKGTIVNVSSVGGVIALPLGAWYYASKHALEAFSDTLRMEVDQFGIDVVVVQPGIIETGFEDQTAAQLREYSGDGPYRAMAEGMARKAEEGLTDGSDPAVVAAVVREAIEAELPRTRYAVGHLADKLLELRRELPDREWDALATRTVLLEERTVEGEARPEGERHDRPGRRPGRQDLLQDEEDRGRRAVPVLGEDLAGGRERGRVEAEAVLDGVEDARAARVDGPGRDVLHIVAVAAEEVLDERADVFGERVRDLRREPHAEAEIGDVPGHLVAAGGVGAGVHVDDAQTRGGLRAQDDRGGGVREERVGDHLLGVDRGGLQVQRREFEAEQGGRAVMGGHVVGDRGEGRERSVAAGVSDEEPAGVRGQREHPRDFDVEAGRAVAGAGGDREQADLVGVGAGVFEGVPDGFEAERRRAVAAHAFGSGPVGDGLELGRVGRGVAAAHVGAGEDALGDAAAGEVPAEHVLPELVLLVGGRKGGADAGEAGGHHRGTSASWSGSSPRAATPSQSAHTSEVAGCSAPQRASR
jgi:short-subunit dehydrogenase